MIYKRLCALLLALSMLAAATSCGRIIIEDISSVNSNIPETSETDEADNIQGVEFAEYSKYSYKNGKTHAQKYLDELPAADYNGGTFFITTPDSEYISPDDTATVLSKLAVERNAAVEDALNVKIVTVKAEIGTMAEAVSQSELAGTGYSDLLMIPVNEIGLFTAQDTLINMRDIRVLDTDKPYFNISSAEAASIGDAVYAVAGYASVMPTSIPAVFMNTEVLRDSGVDPVSLYASALRGEWTWDDFVMCTEVVGVLEKFNTLTAQSTAEAFADIAFKSVGNDFIVCDDGVQTVGYTPETAQAAVGNISKIMKDPLAAISAENNSVGDFAAGRTAFMVEYLYVMSWLVNSDAKWGILPLPKGNESDSYRSLVSDDTLLFAIPAGSENQKMAAVTLMALNAMSEGYIYDEFVEYSMTHVLRDNDSVNMLDLILGTATFDIALTYGEEYPDLAPIRELVYESIDSGEWSEEFEKTVAEMNKILADQPVERVEKVEEPEKTEAPETEPPATTAPETKPAETTAPETKSAETKPAETKATE